ncbi:MAG: elongation factor G, partial [Deltaproteobacteria bacterium]|nr:elongation factor G [Deltaproteobacteria bacterium]
MAKFATEKMRNLGIVGQGDAGKTSLVEAILFNTGMTDRLGKVDDGSSNMDFEPEETKRKITISSKLHHCEWNGHDLHIVDTPGYTNFLHDTRGCLRVLGGSVLVISAVDGVKAQTQTLWKWSDEFEIPRLAFINKLDRERADFLKAIDDMEKTLSCRPVAVNMPIGQAEDFKGVIDLITMKARLFQFDEKGSYEEKDIPDDLQEEAQRLHVMLMEACAEADDELMEKYLETEQLSAEEMKRGLREGILTGVFTPVLCGSATANIGIRQLLDYIVISMPSPIDKGTQYGTNPKTGDEESRQPDPAEPFSAMVFKTVSDPFTGKLSLFRVYSGTVKSDSTVYNASKETNERIGQILLPEGKKQKPVTEAVAGDIVAVAKLKETTTGDTLCDSAKPIVYESPISMKPVISFALEPKSKGDEEKIFSGLSRLTEEDPALNIQRDEETKEMIISGMGQVHVEVAIEKLKRKFGADVILKEPKVPY